MEDKTNLEKSLKIVFWGTPEFAVPSLKALIDATYTVLAVITGPDMPVGRRQESYAPPVKRLAEARNIPVLQPTSLKDEQFTVRLREHAPDCFVVVAYGKIIPSAILREAMRGAINLHPSLLPSFRGPSPIEGALLAGEKETGMTVILMDEIMDHGPILYQEPLPIEEGETRITLTEKLAELGASALIKTLPEWFSGRITPRAQDHKHATYTKILTREDGKLYWDRPAAELLRHIRAYLGWPGSFCAWQKGTKLLRLKIISARALSETKRKGAYGTVWHSEEAPLAVKTPEGSLQIVKLQAEGGKPQDAEEFLRGHPDIIGSILL